MGLINDSINTGTKQARNFIDQMESYVISTSKVFEGMASGYEKGLKEFDRSINYDDRPSVTGEAKALSPLQFLQFTPVKIVGVTRLPQNVAEAVGYVVKNRNVFISPVKAGKSWIQNTKKDLVPYLEKSKPILEKGLKNLRPTAVIVGSNLKKGLREITPKNQRTAGMMTGTFIAGSIMNGEEAGKTIMNGLESAMNGHSKRNEEDLILSRKVSRKRWV